MRHWLLIGLLALPGCYNESLAAFVNGPGHGTNNKLDPGKLSANRGAGDPSPVFQADFTNPSQSPGDCTGSSVLHVDFDETSGNLTENCNSGSFVAQDSATYEVSAPSGLGTGIDLDGSNDYFVLTGDSAYDIGTSDFTLWMWLNNGAAAKEPFMKWGGSGSAGLRLRNGTTDPRLSVQNDLGAGFTWIPNDGDANTPTWVLYCWEGDRDSAAAPMFVDGQQSSTVNATSLDGVNIDNNDDKIAIGARATGSTFWPGGIADLGLAVGVADCATYAPFVTGIEATGFTETFTRATASTRTDPATGLAGQTVISGNPVIEAPVWDGETLPASTDAVGLFSHRTNWTFRVLHNEDYSNAAWVETGASVVSATDSATDPGGGSRADTISDDDAGTAEKICQTINTTSGWWTHCSAWYKNASGTPTPVFEVDGTQATCDAADATWQKCVSSEAPASGATIDVCWYPAGTTASNTGDTYLWRVSCMDSVNYLTKTAGWAAPLEPATTSSEVTVNADQLSYDWQPGDTGTVLYWAIEFSHSGNGWLADGADDMYWDPRGVGQRFLTTGLADNADVRATFSLTNAWTHLGWAWSQSAGTVLLTQDGVEAACTTCDKTWTAGGTYGNIKTNSQALYTSRFKAYDVALTEAQINTIYTAESGSGYAHAYNPKDVMWARYRMRQPDFPQPVFAKTFTREEMAHAGSNP